MQAVEYIRHPETSADNENHRDNHKTDARCIEGKKWQIGFR